MTECEMKEKLGGMHWTPDAVKLAIPYFEVPKKCAAVFNQNMAIILWHMLGALNENRATLPQVETILGGSSVNGLRVDELIDIAHYAGAARHLARVIREEEFTLDKETACFLQHHVGKEGSQKTPSEFRPCNVYYDLAIYRKAPDFEQLDSLANEGFAYLNEEIANPKVRAIATFLFMERSLFFLNSNSQTASLMMNGVLMSNGYLPITLFVENSRAFRKELPKFYATGNADPLFSLFASFVGDVYSVSQLPKDFVKKDPWS